MKKLYIIGGTMGVGKTTVGQQLKKDLPNSVFLDGQVQFRPGIAVFDLCVPVCCGFERFDHRLRVPCGHKILAWSAEE